MKRIGFLVFVMPLVFCLAGCGGLDSMIDEYNSRFGIHDDEWDAEGNKIIDGQEMLEKSYTISPEQSLSIPAPIQGATYLWTVHDKSAAAGEGEEKMRQEGPAFVLKAGSQLGVGDYTLTLTVTVGVKSYTDEAVLTVHNESRSGT